MKYVVVDLEMNGVSKSYKEERKICRQETIEFGAVLLDESFKEVSSFKTYVKPVYNDAIERKITKLTGITDEMVADAPEFIEAFKMFIDFCKSANDEVLIIEWSENDELQLTRELRQKNYEMNEEEAAIMENWFDLQKEFASLLGYSFCVSLENALLYAGEEFEGNMHDALYDAKNTANLFVITNDEERRVAAIDKINNMMHSSVTNVSLGDMIDFSALLSAV